MNKFINNIKVTANVTANEKGGKAYHSTLNPLLDLFSKIGIPNSNIIDLWNSAKAYNKTKAYQILLWSRDILNGAGLRSNYIDILNKTEGNHTDMILAAVKAGIGYWKDILKLSYSDMLFIPWVKAIREGDKLAAKWFPRKGYLFSKLTKQLGSPKLARKFIVSNSDTVEQKVCAKNFKDINYSHVPSKALKLHTPTFEKFDQIRFTEHISKVLDGTAKVNSKALYPYEILRANYGWNVKEAQWMSLPEFFTEHSYLPVIDCSGSMEGSYRNLVPPIDVAHSLGIYCSERNKSVFKDKLITFSHNPRWIELSGTLNNKVAALQRHSEVANTDLNKVFKLILDTAVDNEVPQTDLPDFLLIISDGQFDSMTREINYGWYDEPSDRAMDPDTIFESYDRLFTESGYTMPKVVFWNVANAETFPSTIHNGNVILISGNSPTVMQFLNSLDVIQVMEDAIAPYLEIASLVQ